MTTDRESHTRAVLPRVKFRRIVISAGVGLLPAFAALLSTLVLWRLIGATSTPQEIGLFAICTQATLYLVLLQLGLDSAASLTMAELLAVGRSNAAADQFHYLVRSNRKISLGVFALVTIAAAVCGIAPIPPAPLGELAAGFLGILGATQIVGFFSRPYSAALAADHHMLALSWLRVGQSLLAFLIGLTVYYFGAGIFSLAVGELGAQILATAVLRGLCRSWCGWTRLPPTAEHRGGEQFRRAAILSLGTLGWAIEYGSDILLLQLLPNGLALAAMFALWSRFPALAQNICVTLNNNTMTPLKSAWATDRAAAAALFRRLILTQIGLSFVVAVAVGIWLPSIMHYWLNAGYDLPEARIISVCLAGSLAARSVVQLLYLGCSAFDAQHDGNLAIWLCVLAKAILGLSLAFEYGLSGFLVAGFIAWLIAFAAIAASLVRIRAAGTRLFAAAFAALVALWFVPWIVQPSVRADTLKVLIFWLVASAFLGLVALLGWLLATGVLRTSNFFRKPQ